MSGIRPRRAWMTFTMAATVASSALLTGSAHAVSGEVAKDGTYAFTVKLDIERDGGKRGCSGALVDKQWVLTAARCFAANPGKDFRIDEGAPKGKATATIGRPDLSGTGGSVTDIAELVPYAGRDLVMARLAKPVSGVTPVAIGTNPVATGEQLTVAGFGRTKTEWVPNTLHTAAFTVDAVQNTSIGITGKDAAVCKGDTGGPALRESGGRVELVAVNSTSWQGGCLGTDPAETRTGAVDTRVDDLGAWVQQVRYRPVFAAAPWAKATHIASGYFTGGSAGGTRHMDMIVRWNDAEVTLYQGSEDKDPRHPFSAEYQLAEAPKPPKTSIWQHVEQITGASFGGGTDGLVVRWDDGELTQYTHVDKNGFHGEKQLAKAKNTVWPHATQLTAGRYTANAQRDDMIVTWDDGRVTFYNDLDTNGVRTEKTLVKKNTTWAQATQISAGEFTGKKTADLFVHWSDGEVTLYPGVDAAGTHGETQIRPRKSYWAHATVVTAGAFVANDRPNDVLVRWDTGAVTLFPDADAAGLHSEFNLLH
ncbi:S1 family peptidase [Streptomyces sioyaensis]|uniref:S1 family peptidase n=1 Tax=Streptomyces sioyaensis TaxID=67364 RepID=UPI0036641C53